MKGNRKGVLEQIMPYLADRIQRSYQNEVYEEFLKKADLIFEKLDDSLNDEQSELLEQYFTANNAAQTLAKKLVYEQGIMDLLDLLIFPAGNLEIK